MTKHKPAPNLGLPARGRGRPSKAELALRASLAGQVASAPVAVGPTPLQALIATLATLTGPPEPTSRPIMPPSPPAPPVAPPPPAPPVRAECDVNTLSAADREDPRKLWGEALRRFAHERGISRSEMTDWPDEKIRQQVGLIIHRQYHEYA